MPYDTELAHRIRALLTDEANVAERAMFGGLGFLIGGHMAVAASGQGGLMVRVPPERTEELVGRDHVSPMVMAGREIRGWVRVADDGIRTARQLGRWVRLGVGYARALPPK